MQRKGPVWRRINSLFDAIDAATVDDRDGDVTLTELKKFFTKTPELQQHYREKVDHRLVCCWFNVPVLVSIGWFDPCFPSRRSVCKTTLLSHWMSGTITLKRSRNKILDVMTVMQQRVLRSRKRLHFWKSKPACSPNQKWYVHCWSARCCTPVH